MDAKPSRCYELADELRKRRARSILIRMATNGQLLELRCEMPTCYCPKGRREFDSWYDVVEPADRKWCPNPDHYPTLDKDGGILEPANVRLAHVFCNNQDYGWRTKIQAMLRKEPAKSFGEIAEELNRKQKKYVPPGSNKWTAATVRKAYVS